MPAAFGRFPREKPLVPRVLENAIQDKMLKIDEPGETTEEISFSEEEGPGENLEKD